jgi:carbon starvation protein
MVVLAMIVYGVIAIRRALGDPKSTAIEIGLPETITGAKLA